MAVTPGELYYWWARHREAARALWEKWRYLLDWPRTQSPILPAHHNFVAEGIIRYAEVEGFYPEIRYKTVKEGDEVWAVHVSELVTQINILLSRIEYNIGPYISDIPLWKTIQSLASNMNKPSKGDAILYSDYYYPMAVIYYLTQLFLNPVSWEPVSLGEGATAEVPLARVVIARENYWGLFKKYIGDYDVVVFDITASAASPSELLEIMSNKIVKVMILCDTQISHGASIQTFYDIFYIYSYIKISAYALNYNLVECASQHFGSSVFYALADYAPSYLFKREDTVIYGLNGGDPPQALSFRYLGKGHIMEVPYDGCWRNAHTLERCLSFKPCSGTESFPWNRVFWFGLTITNMPEWHQYPTVVDTFKALVGADNVIVYE